MASKLTQMLLGKLRRTLICLLTLNVDKIGLTNLLVVTGK